MKAGAVKCEVAPFVICETTQESLFSPADLVLGHTVHLLQESWLVDKQGSTYRILDYLSPIRERLHRVWLMVPHIKFIIKQHT